MIDKNETVYITGHIHPDTDSVVSAIAYAFFKRTQGYKAVPCRLGQLNAETAWLLKKFDYEPPMVLEDARKTLAEIDLDPPASITPETTIYETIMKMQKEGSVALAVVDQKGEVVGMVTKSDLTSVGLGDTAGGIELLKNTSIDSICKTISGKMIYRDVKFHLNGKVSIIALTKTKLENYEIKDRIVIVGDDPEAQKALIEKGAGLLIAVWAEGIEDSVIETAKKHHCPVIISGHGSMNTSRYIYFAPPVRFVMSKNIVTLHTTELAEDAARKMMNSRFRTYPVVDQEGHLKGYAGRYHMMNYKNKQIILVDHNEFSQSVRAVEKAQLMEVVDHHRICDFATSQPVSFRNEIVGSTATIIATMFRENQIPMPKNLASILLGAVLSDTLIFQSPTTTPKDIETANILAALADLDIEAFGHEMFTVSSDNGDKSLTELLSQDVKHFEIRTCHTMISQIMVKSLEDIRARAEDIQEDLNRFAEKKGTDLFVAAFTSVNDKGSVFFYAGDKAVWMDEAYPDNPGEVHSIQKGILSRKQQILPRITEVVNRHA